MRKLSLSSVLFLGTILLLAACQPTLRVITGIKKPRVENVERIENYLAEQKLVDDPERNFYLPDEASFYGLRIFRDSLYRLPDVYLFNSAGEFLEENQLCLTTRSKEPRVDQLNYFSNIFQVDSILSKKLAKSDLERFMVNAKGEKVKLPEGKTAVILWSKFLGDKINRKHIIGTREQIMNSDQNIAVFYLNLDIQENWAD